MGWQLSGRFHEFCHCDLLCPCLFDATARPDQGWCGSVLTFDIERGTSDGVDLTGRRAVVAVNTPGTFAEGNFTARLYVDDGADEPQRRALEQIFTGQQGGPWEAVAPAFAQWLPTKTAPITVQWGDKPEIVIGDVGRLVSDPGSTRADDPSKWMGCWRNSSLALRSSRRAPSAASSPTPTCVVSRGTPVSSARSAGPCSAASARRSGHAVVWWRSRERTLATDRGRTQAGLICDAHRGRWLLAHRPAGRATPDRRGDRRRGMP